MYLLGLAISNLCVLVTAIPALHDNSGGLNSDTYATAFYQAQLLSFVIDTLIKPQIILTQAFFNYCN